MGNKVWETGQIRLRLRWIQAVASRRSTAPVSSTRLADPFNVQWFSVSYSQFLMIRLRMIQLSLNDIKKPSVRTSLGTIAHEKDPRNRVQDVGIYAFAEFVHPEDVYTDSDGC